MSDVSDIFAHLRPSPVDVAFDGQTYTIPTMDAVDWVKMIEGERVDLYDIFPRLCGIEAIEHVEDALWEDRITIDDVGRVSKYAIGAAADRPWWVATNIISVARRSWDIVHVNNAAGMSLAGWLDEVWSKMMAHVDPAKRQTFVSDVTKTPKGWEGEVDFTAEEANFLAAMNAVMK